MIKQKRKPSITSKIVAFIVAALIISNAAVGIISFNLHRNQTITARGSEALHIAVTMARRIDGNQFEEIMRVMEKNEYWYEVKAYADALAEELGTAYLYLVGAGPDGDVVYFAEGTLYDPYDLGVTEEADAYAPEMFETLESGRSSMTGAYSSGEYGKMVSGFAAVFNARGEAVGVVGVDFFLDDILAEVNAFGLSILTIVIVFIVLLFFVSTYIGKKFIGGPLTGLDEAAKQLARGDMDIRLDIRTKSEIGRLSQSFKMMVNAIREQVSALEAVSGGDLTVDTKPRGEKDAMGYALARLLGSLGAMLSEINHTTAQVSKGAGQISDGAQMLAQGATEQVASIEEISATITELNEMVKSNAKKSMDAKDSNDTAGRYLSESVDDMEKTLSSMRSIGESSQKITHIIKVIDDIAFQTNILALNASVEAARAGQHGKGFAVVADEVRNLASKSAAAASETAELIEECAQRVIEGGQAVELTNKHLKTAAQYAREATVLADEVAAVSANQESAITELCHGVEQVSQVVQQNSAIAEESAAASEEMSAQAAMLYELIGRFRIKENRADDSVASRLAPASMSLSAWDGTKRGEG